MGGASSKVASRASASAVKRKLPKYDAAEKASAEASSAAAEKVQAPPLEAPKPPPEWDPELAQTSSDDLDVILKQLAGSINTKTVSIPRHQLKSANANSFESQQPTEALLSAAELERVLRGVAGEAFVERKGVNKDLLEKVRKHLRVPVQEDYS